MGISIEKAIERLPVIEELMATDFSSWDSLAVHLGIEGLKRIQLQRKTMKPYLIHSLPGETWGEEDTKIAKVGCDCEYWKEGKCKTNTGFCNHPEYDSAFLLNEKLRAYEGEEEKIAKRDREGEKVE